MMTTPRRYWLIAAVLWCAVLGSAAGAIYTKHRARALFVELERSYGARDQLDITWGQWQAEQSTLSAHSQVEAFAVEKLSMVTPDPARIQLVNP
jgi:cell division protein FtsL